MDLNILSRVFDPILTLEPEGSRAKVGPEAFASGRVSPEDRHHQTSPALAVARTIQLFRLGPTKTSWTRVRLEKSASSHGIEPMAHRMRPASEAGRASVVWFTLRENMGYFEPFPGGINRPTQSI